MNRIQDNVIFILLVFVALTACGGSSENNQALNLVETDNNTPPVTPDPVPADDPLDVELRDLIEEHGLTGNPAVGRDLPSITDPLPQLGKKLFFTKALGGDMDVACVSCHHPTLGGADGLSLSIGIDALDPDLLGPGRRNSAGIPEVPRNAPTTFNAGLWDHSLFWDSRVESDNATPGANGAGSGISTPDTGFLIPDPNAGDNLVMAQARFPVTSVEEMRGVFEAGNDNNSVRNHLAARIGDYANGAGELDINQWYIEFQTAFVSSEPAAELISFENIAMSIAAYQRSQVFINNPWKEYVEGNNDAISDQAKNGAILFLTDADQGGGGCVQCHSGDFFTDERPHNIGMPQFGPGKGNTNNADFGRENITANANDRFKFRTPALLNVAVTAPYGHSGAYETLREMVDHYDNPNANQINDFFDDGGWCELDQFSQVQNCEDLYPDARQNSLDAVRKIQQERNQNDPDALENINLNNNEVNQLVEFLETLTDPCVVDRNCLAPWIPTIDEDPDAQQVDAINRNGERL